MNARAKKFLLLLLPRRCSPFPQVQKSMDRDRVQLGLTISEPLQNAPPMLAFTTVALGGFRGLISNYLWMRANDLQLDDKYLEAAQLADWITDLEPHFATVWVFQAWNMAYNISVKFKENAPGDFSTAGAGCSAALNCCATAACATIRMTLPFTFNSASSFNINRRESRRR